MINMSETVEKKSFTFGFSKTKPKVNLSKNDSVKAFDFGGSKKEEDSIELITGLEGKKVKSVHKQNVVKKPLIIPCQKNELNFNVSSKTSAEDMEVINALIADSEEAKNKKVDDSKFVIPADKIETKVEKNIEEANYDEVGIEQFGLAALRGMGWSEKNGLGLSNKRQSEVIEVEIRPRGLGLGAGSSKKKKTSDSNGNDRDEDDGLKYAVGAYIQITEGKHDNEYGKIVSFGDGLSRIVVQLHSSDEKVSVLQACTKLLSRSDYKRGTEKNSERGLEREKKHNSDRNKDRYTYQESERASEREKHHYSDRNKERNTYQVSERVLERERHHYSDRNKEQNKCHGSNRDSDRNKSQRFDRDSEKSSDRYRR